MRLARPVLLASLVVAAAVVVVPAAAQPRVLALGAPAVPVTGHELTVAGYQRLGLDARQAALHRQLDHFAADGVDVHLLNTALASSESSSSAPVVADDLVDVGNLDGKGSVELAEERYLSSSSGQRLQLVVRDGMTGAPLWTRTDTVSGKKLLFAFGAPVGAAGRPGVLVWVIDFSSGVVTTTALDGRGHQVWRAPLTPPQADPPPVTPPVGLTTTDSVNRFSLTAVGVRLQPGPLDIVMMTETEHESSGDLGTSRSGAVAFSAVSLATGRSRTLPGSTSSSGAVAGDVVDDADGDGYADLLTVDGGKHVVTVLRASSGATVWSRSDAFSGDLLGGFGVPTVLGERAGRGLAEDVVLLTRPSPGPLDPVLGSSPGAGTVTLLGGHTGRSAWTKPGTDVYVLHQGVGRGLGVLEDRSTTTSSTAQAAAVLTAYDPAGRTTWTRSFSMSAPVSGSGFAVAFAYAYSFDDFDRDGAFEGIVSLVILTDSAESERDTLLRGKDGATLPPMSGYPLLGGVRRGHHDLASLRSSSGELVLTVLDAVTRARLLRTGVPGSKGATGGYVYADAVSKHVCDDLVVTGAGQGRTVVAVLASSGRPRWSVSRSGTDTRLGTVVRPAKAPVVSC